MRETASFALLSSLRKACCKREQIAEHRASQGMRRHTLVRDSRGEAVSTLLTMFDIFLASSPGGFLTKFARRHEERTKLIMSASRGILLSSFLTCAAGFSSTKELAIDMC